MAIDTDEKRRSISGGMIPLLIPGVTPNASKDAEWRQQSAWMYSGIAVGEAPTGRVMSSLAAGGGLAGRGGIAGAGGGLVA